MKAYLEGCVKSLNRSAGIDRPQPAAAQAVVDTFRLVFAGDHEVLSAIERLEHEHTIRSARALQSAAQPALKAARKSSIASREGAVRAAITASVLLADSMIWNGMYAERSLPRLYQEVECARANHAYALEIKARLAK